MKTKRMKTPEETPEQLTDKPSQPLADRVNELPEDYLLTKNEARGLLRMGIKCFEAKVRSGEIATVKNSPKRVFVRAGDVRRYIRQRSSSDTTKPDDTEAIAVAVLQPARRRSRKPR